MRIGKPFKSNGEFYITGTNYVLNLEILHDVKKRNMKLNSINSFLKRKKTI